MGLWWSFINRRFNYPASESHIKSKRNSTKALPPASLFKPIILQIKRRLAQPIRQQVHLAFRTKFSYIHVQNWRVVEILF